MYIGPDGGLTCAAGLAARDILWKNSLKLWTMNLRLNCHTSAVIGFRPFGPQSTYPKKAKKTASSLSSFPVAYVTNRFLGELLWFLSIDAFQFLLYIKKLLYRQIDFVY